MLETLGENKLRAGLNIKTWKKSKHLAHILWYQPKKISKLEDSWVLSNVFHNVSLTWLVEEVASSISMMGPEKISAGYPSYFSCWPVLLGFLVFPQLEQRVSSNIFFLIFGGAQMTSCEGGRSTPNWDLVGASILCSLLILDSCPVAPPQVSQDPNHHHQQWVQSADMMPDSHMTHICSAFYLYRHHHYHRYRIELWV